MECYCNRIANPGANNAHVGAFRIVFAYDCSVVLRTLQGFEMRVRQRSNSNVELASVRLEGERSRPMPSATKLPAARYVADHDFWRAARGKVPALIGIS